MLHLKDFGKVDSAAREALKRATATLRDGTDIDPKETENVSEPTAKLLTKRLVCIVCHERVHAPCWYCIRCTGEYLDSFCIHMVC